MKLFVACKALIVNSEGNFLIIRESGTYEEGTNLGRWDVPGGRIQVEETLAEGLKREVLEEVGLEVVSGSLLSVSENFPNIKGETVHIIRLYYQCQAQTDKVTLSIDHDSFVWIDPDENSQYDLIEGVGEALKSFKPNL